MYCIDKNIDIKFSGHKCFWNNLHQAWVPLYLYLFCGYTHFWNNLHQAWVPLYLYLFCGHTHFWNNLHQAWVPLYLYLFCGHTHFWNNLHQAWVPLYLYLFCHNCIDGLDFYLLCSAYLISNQIFILLQYMYSYITCIYF